MFNLITDDESDYDESDGMNRTFINTPSISLFLICQLAGFEHTIKTLLDISLGEL